ncbi:hypothetical protein DL766_004758 [Monosporascus sp. MC13-8B]|nr:hypothetical protein DL763_003058 [Monosporascus cannonballus]RYP30662.1 hypothetical protein DL766_004758 [Monosporascus sp. MC13-8B]
MANLSAISIFESDAGFSLSMHRTGGGSSVYRFQNFGVVKATLLSLRSIATVGNYAYIFDYAFHVDGSLGGHRVQHPVGHPGPLHEHVVIFKADFGILGVNNSLRVSELKAAPTSQPLWRELGLRQVASRQNPQQDFTRFLDGEGVDGKDIVVWFKLGMHHFTHTEDAPVTLYSEAVNSVLFAPQNFFEQAQEGNLRNRRWIVPDAEGDELVVQDFGIELLTFFEY